jgi:cell wall-associated NlpC family hydrolase
VAGRGIYFSALGAGILLFWSGFKGWGVTATIQDIITGRQPAGPAVNAPQNVLTSQAAGQAAAASGNAIADDALQYRGHAYRYGGAPGTGGTSPWDCSSFCNWVLSRDLGLAWPGAGRYDGASHGPPTGSWGSWLRARGMAVRGGIASAQAGDVIVWAGHMGIATGGGNMVSALNAREGTRVTPIQGYGNGPLLAVGRYAQIVPTPTGQPSFARQVTG